MPKVVIEQLKSLKHGAVAPRAEWKAQNRAMLLSQIKNTMPVKSHTKSMEKLWAAFGIFLPQTVVFGLVRPLAMMMVVIIVAPSLYYGTVLASRDALPGEGLYGAKRYTERIQATFVSMLGDAQAQTKLHVEFALRRANEASQMITTANDPSKLAQAASTVADLKTEIDSISTGLEDNSAAAASDIKKNTTQITNVLQAVKNNLLIASVSTSTDSTSTDKVLAAAAADISQVTKAVENISDSTNGTAAGSATSTLETVSTSTEAMGASVTTTPVTSTIINASSTDAVSSSNSVAAPNTSTTKIDSDTSTKKVESETSTKKQ